MGISKTEINLMRLIAAAPRQTNQTKLAHVSPGQFYLVTYSYYCYCISCSVLKCLSESIDKVCYMLLLNYEMDREEKFGVV